MDSSFARFPHRAALAGRVDLRPMVTRAFPLAQAREAFELASDRRRAMKVLIDFDA